MRSLRRDIMVAAPGSSPSHRFWYARVIGIYHAIVRERDDQGPEEWRRVDFLWVRWFVLDESRGASGGFDKNRLDRIHFVSPNGRSPQFGFVHPSRVIRACHIIPAFHHGRTTEYLGAAGSFVQGADLADWKYYYVNRYVKINS